MTALTDAEKTRINAMCPVADAVGIGTHIQAVENSTAGLANAVAGVVSGYKVARGVTSVTGDATAIVTGLTTVVTVTASLGAAIDITKYDTVTVALNAAAGKIDLHVTKPTTANNVAAIASTDAVNIHWIAVGT